MLCHTFCVVVVQLQETSFDFQSGIIFDGSKHLSTHEGTFTRISSNVGGRQQTSKAPARALVFESRWPIGIEHVAFIKDCIGNGAQRVHPRHGLLLPASARACSSICSQLLSGAPAGLGASERSGASSLQSARGTRQKVSFD